MAKLSKCEEVSSGIPQGSVLGPLLFVIFINDLPQFCGNSSELFLFADDAKIFKHIIDVNDSTVLNNYGQELYNWSEKWLMKLNLDKCKILTLGRSKNINEHDYCFQTSSLVQ